MEDQTDIFNESQAEKLRRKGVDMSWYERSKSKRLSQGQHTTGPPPLHIESCCSLSIYLLKADGSLWTVDGYGKAYLQVRPPGKPVPHATLLCACCKRQFRDSDEAYKHYNKETQR